MSSTATPKLANAPSLTPDAKGAGGFGAPKGGWSALIDEIAAGRWTSRKTSRRAPPSSTRSLVIDTSLEGREADLVTALAVPDPIAVVADANTWEAMGRRITGALACAGRTVTGIVLDGTLHADMATAADLDEKVRGFGHVIAVGSGTLNDLCKWVTFRDGRSSSVFGTAASMDGYASSTASITKTTGLKVSHSAHAPVGVFLDLAVMAAAPPRLAAAGFGDCLNSSVARIDWWLSHRLWGTHYFDEPYEMQADNEQELNSRVEGLPRGEIEAVGYLVRALVLSGLGIGFTGTSEHGSQGEHQISHYIDCFAGRRHPGSLHGHQVGLASLTMARIQQWFLAQKTPPELRPTRIDPEDMARRMGPEIVRECLAEYRRKALDTATCDCLNARLANIWPELRRELAAFAVPVETMQARLAAAGGATTAIELGLDPSFYREAVRHGHEMRNRWGFADWAADAGLLDGFAEAET
jgi:glycerol-1-phosphate dehydrogenase [NAD(P)+]